MAQASQFRDLVRIEKHDGGGVWSLLQKCRAQVLHEGGEEQSSYRIRTRGVYPCFAELIQSTDLGDGYRVVWNTRFLRIDEVIDEFLGEPRSKTVLLVCSYAPGSPAIND